MKKIRGILFLLFGSVLVFSFLFITGMVFFSPEHFNMDKVANSRATVIGYFFISLLMGIGFILAGLSLVKKPDTTVVPLPAGFASAISVRIHLTFQEYAQANLTLLSGGARMYIYPVVFIVLLINVISNPSISENNYTIIILLALLFGPLILYLAYRRNYDSQKAIQEGVTYTITRTDIHAKCSSFDSVNSWSNVFKALETKRYFFIYSSAAVAYIIPKSAFAQNEDIGLLRNIIRSHSFERKLLKH